jgi:hypothetical protein
MADMVPIESQQRRGIAVRGFDMVAVEHDLEVRDGHGRDSRQRPIKCR